MTTRFHTSIARLRRLGNIARRAANFHRISRSVVDLAPSVATLATAHGEHPGARRLAVHVVDDPDGAVRLIGVRGPVTAANVLTLLDVTDDLDDGLELHLDLSDATIQSADALSGLESNVDELERRGVKLRVVGIDPEILARLATTN